MNDIVSPETAVKLLEAGWPQPQNADWRLLYKGPSDCVVVQTEEALYRGFYIGDSLVHAPTATDILKNALGRIHLTYSRLNNTEWVAVLGKTAIKHANAAEAAAAAWLELNRRFMQPKTPPCAGHDADL